MNKFFISNSEMFINFVEYFATAWACGFLLSLLRDIRYLGFSIVLSVVSVCIFSVLGVASSEIFWVLLLIESIYFSKKIANPVLMSSFSMMGYVSINYLVKIIFQQFGLMENIFPSSILLITLVFYVLDIYILKIIFKKFNIPTDNNMIIWIVSSLSVIAICSYFILEIYERIFEKKIFFEYTNLFFINLYGIAFVVSAVIVGFAVKERNDLKRRNQDEIYMHEYIESLEKTNTEIRRFKHDYQNTLLSMKGYFDNHDLKGLKDFYQSHLLHAVGNLSQQTLDASKFSNLGVREVKSLLISKVLQAQGQNITISIEIPNEVRTINANAIFLVRCLGIILDNAIESAVKIEKGWIRIGFIRINNHGLDIIVENSSESSLPPLHQLKITGFSTKGENRGIGLSNLDLLISKSSNCTLETRITENVFTQIIHIYGEDTNENLYMRG
ncbi:MAG: GHKL domain-containing protein [Enterococcus sp.]